MTPVLMLGAFSGAFVSGLFPLVNAELLLIGLSLGVAPAAWPILVVTVAAGQMTGKALLFLTGGRIAGPALAARLERWGLNGRRLGGGMSLVALSAAVGLPPFYLVAVAAPALGVGLGTFFAVGLAGRIARFAAVLAIPGLVSALTR